MRRRAASREEIPPSLDGLATELIRRARTTPNDNDDVVLDLEQQGLRCLLIRSHAESADKKILSPREREIARMVAEGLPNKSIAAILDISSWTVGSHLRRIFAKLGVTSRAAMVAKLLRP